MCFQPKHDMTSPPKISLIIPCHNAQKTLERTLRSALNQTYSELEILVIDDGSTDDSALILEKYSADIQVFHQKNQGAHSARMHGLWEASGDWICFLDADDTLAAETLEKQIKWAQKNPTADVIYCHAQQIFESTKEQYKMLNKAMPNSPERALIRDFWLPISAYLFRKNIINNSLIINELEIFNDTYLVWLLAHQKAKFIENPFLGTTYFVQTDSLSRRKGLLNYFADRMRYLELVEQHLRPAMDSETAQILTQAHRDGNRIFVRESPELFEQCTAKIYELTPNYIPQKSLIMKILSRILGYKKAEQTADKYRKIFDWVRFYVLKNSKINRIFA